MLDRRDYDGDEINTNATVTVIEGQVVSVCSKNTNGLPFRLSFYYYRTNSLFFLLIFISQIVIKHIGIR